MATARIPKPSHAPITLPYWSSRAQWPVPFHVRYRVSFVNGRGQEGPLSDWSPVYSSSEFSNARLQNFPTDPTGTARAIHLYRNFEGQTHARRIYTIPYPAPATVTDHRHFQWGECN